MVMKVIAQRGTQLLVSVDDRYGFILDNGVRYPTMATGSLLARGYWKPSSMAGDALSRLLGKATNAPVPPSLKAE